MRYATAHGLFGRELVEALGLKGRRITGITLRVMANEAAQVRVTELLRDENTNELLSTVRRYKLVPADGAAGIDGPRPGPAADGSQKPNDAAAIPCAKAGSNGGVPASDGGQPE